MGERLEIRTLGSLNIQAGGQPITGFDSRKVPALLVYLACTRREHPREVLAEMLWEERTQAQALANLRVALNSLRQTTGEYVEISRETVGLNAAAEIWLDAAEFEKRLTAADPDDAGALDTALALYQGDFLAGFFVDSTAFEQWATRERERLRLRVMEGLDRLIDCHLTRREYTAGIAAATRLLDIDPLREETHRQMMRLLALSGQRGKALEQFETCRQMLEDDLGIEPTSETRALYERIRAGETLEPPTQAAPILPPIRGYQLRERIGEGGFGTIYRAWQPVVNREVAIKIIRPEFANQPDFIRRFETEAQTVARLEHPHIVPLYDYWREPGGAFLVMRYLRGGSLRDRLSQGALSLSEAVRLVEQMCAALTVAHRAGVVHRDLKPANLLLDEEGNAYLADFGIAKALVQSGQITHEGALVGSPAYLAPEQVRSEPVTPQSDLYSLGILLYEALAGQPPFPPGLTPSALLYKQLSEPLPSLRQTCPDLPPALDDVIQRATAKDPTQRFPDALSLARAFRETAGAAGFPVSANIRSTSPSPLLAAHEMTRTWTPADELVTLRNPYKGLRPFEEADAADFFGRDALIGQLVARLGEDDPLARFLAVIGPSGSGKSSVVKAGLVPALRRGALPGSEGWFVAEIVPGGDPLRQLEAALFSIAAKPPTHLLKQLQADPHGLLWAVDGLLSSREGDLLLVVDQFEELFAPEIIEEERAHFLDLLRLAVTDPHSRLRMIATLRADFTDRPLQYVAFGELMRHRTEFVLPMNAPELEQVITGPAEHVGAKIDPALLSAIIADVSEEPGVLPLLQYALYEVFERREERVLTLAGYQAIGGVLGALARRAEEVYIAQHRMQHAITRQVFLRLVTLGEGTEDTRRRVRCSELASLMDDPEPLQTVLDTFGRARLFTLDGDPITREPTVEVAHEALIRAWARLRGWLDESRGDIRQERLLAAAATEWQQAGQEISYLLSGARLAQFEEWARTSSIALTQEEHDYLQSSVAEHHRQEAIERERQEKELILQKQSANRLRTLVAGLAVFLVAALALSIFAFGKQREAENARATSDANSHLAETNAGQAQELALVNGAQAALNKGDPDTALALAVAANQGQHPSAQAQVVLSRAAYPPGPVKAFGDHQGFVWAAAYSPDGETILTMADEGLIWRNVESGEILQRFPIGYTSFSFTPNSRQLLTASWKDGRITLWDLATGQEARRFASDELLGAWSQRVTVNPDGLTFLSTNGDTSGTGQPGKLLQWNIKTGEIIRTFAGHQGRIESFKISSDGKRILSSAQTGEVILWDMETGAIIHRFEPDDLGITSYIGSLALLPDGHRAILRSEAGPMALWDLDSFQLLLNYEVPLDSDPTLLVAVSPDGRAAITGGSQVMVWDVETGLKLAILPSYGAVVGFSRDSRLAFAATGEAVYLWDWRNGAELQRWLVPGQYAKGFALSPDGRIILAVITFDNQDDVSCSLAEFDTATGAELWRAAPPQTPGRGFAYAGGCAVPVISPDGHQFLVGRGNGQAILWNADTHQPLRAFTGNTGTVAATVFSPDSRTILTGGGDGTVILWDAGTGQEIRRYPGHTMAVFGLDFSPDGRTFLSSSQDSTIILWDVETGQEIRRLMGHTGGVNSLDISPDGRYALSGADDRRVILWDLATGTPVHILIGHEQIVIHVVFSADGQYALSSDGDEVAILWDLTSGEAIRYYNEAGALSIFDPTGRSFLTRGWNSGAIRRFRIDSADGLLAWTLDHRYVRELTCTEREQYNMESGCDEQGNFPTRTPYPTLQPAAALPVIVETKPAPLLTVTPTMTPGPILVAHVGEQRGEVAPGHAQVWTYEGHAGELLTLRVSADNPANWMTYGEGTPTPAHVMDSLIIITGPDGGDLNAWGDLYLQLEPPESDDIDPGVNTDSLVEGLVLPTDGTYLIEVSGAGYRTGGAYTLTVESTPPGDVIPTPEDTPPGS